MIYGICDTVHCSDFSLLKRMAIYGKSSCWGRMTETALNGFDVYAVADENGRVKMAKAVIADISHSGSFTKFLKECTGCGSIHRQTI